MIPIKGRSIFIPCLAFIIGAIIILGGIFLTSEREALSAYVRTLWVDSSFIRVFLQFALIVLVLYLLLMVLYRLHLLSRKAFTRFLCITMICECLFCSEIFLGYAGNDVTFNREVLDLSGKIEDSSLYRVKLKQKYFDVNLVGSLGYGSVNHYTSFTDADFIYAMKKLGYSSYWLEMSSVGGTLFSDALLGHRYTIDSLGALSGTEEILYSNDRFAILENQFSVPLGILFPETGALSANDISLSEEERLPLQDQVFQKLFGTETSLITAYLPNDTANLTASHDTVYSYRRTDETLTGVLYYQIHVQGTKTLYFDCFDTVSVRLREIINGGCNVYVNGNLVASEYPTQKNNGILELGTFTDQNVLVEVELLKDINARSFGVYGLDHTVLSEALSGLQCVELEQKGNTLSGSAEVEQAGEYLFLSLPYSEGYSACVNGKPVEIIEVLDHFIAIRLETGHNEITLSFFPPGLSVGIAISAISIVILAFACVFFRERSFMEWSRRLHYPVSVVFTSVFFAALFIIYLFPLLVRLILR